MDARFSQVLRAFDMTHMSIYILMGIRDMAIMYGAEEEVVVSSPTFIVFGYAFSF